MRPAERAEGVAAAELRRALIALEALMEGIEGAEAILQDLVHPAGIDEAEAIQRFWRLFDTAPFRTQRREAEETLEALRALLKPAAVAPAA